MVVTISRVCILLAIVGNGKIFTMGPNEQNQHFAELRQKVCFCIHALVLLSCWPSLEGKNELLWDKEEKVVSQTQVRQTI